MSVENKTGEGKPGENGLREGKPTGGIPTGGKPTGGKQVVLRIFEHANRRASASLQFGLPLLQLWETDLMEHSVCQQYEILDNAVELSFRPFEIKTLVAVFGN